MSDNYRNKFEQIFPVPKNVQWNPDWCGQGRYQPVNSLLHRDAPESADIQNQRWIGWKAACEQPTETPAAQWRERGDADPCGNIYNRERASLWMGHLTDDELANEVYRYNHRTGHESMSYLTAAKDRIRWLSRKLEHASVPEIPDNSGPIAGAHGDVVPFYWDSPAIDPIVTKLYQKFKEWSKRGFTADDVTWCEVRAAVAEMLNATPQPPKQEGE